MLISYETYLVDLTKYSSCGKLFQQKSKSSDVKEVKVKALVREETRLCATHYTHLNPYIDDVGLASTFLKFTGGR